MAQERADGRGISRRALIASSASAAAGAALGPGLLPDPALASPARRPPAIGSGGTPMALSELAAMAKRLGHGYPVLFCDLAAVDQNLAMVVGFARRQGWGVRPAMKTFRSPELVNYILRRIPAPRGLVFNLFEVDPILELAPAGTDLMTGYPPTFGELRGYLGSTPPAGQRRSRVRILIDSLPLMKEAARLVRRSRRRLPQEIALELDVGMGRGGINDAAEARACLDVVRASAGRLKLTAVLGYDGHATLDGAPPYRSLVASQAMSAFRSRMAELNQHNGGLFDPRRLIRNGPGSSNYRNWVGGPANEIGVGSAFVFAGYLNGGFDTAGLAPALTMAGAVRRVTSDHPSTPVTGTPLPGARREEIIVQAIGAPGECVYPGGTDEDVASGGGDALVVPKGTVGLGDYVLYRPIQAEDGIRKFRTITAVRSGRVRRSWKVQPRPPY